jgi:hypothetical protein
MTFIRTRMNRDTFRPELLAVQCYFLYIRVIPTSCA